MSASVYDLDDDVLLLVFDAFVPYQGDLVRISHVNRRWRDLAIGTGFLWRNIYSGWIVPATLPLGVAVSRAGSSSSIGLIGNYTSFDETAIFMRKRLTTLRVFMDMSESGFPAWMDAVMGGLPSLITCRLIFQSRPEDEDNIDWSPMNTTNLPALRTFEVSSIYIPWAGSTNLVLPELRRLAIEVQSYIRDMPLILRQYPKLEELKMTFWAEDIAEDPAPDILDGLGRLKRIEVEATYIGGRLAEAAAEMLRKPIPVAAYDWREQETRIPTESLDRFNLASVMREAVSNSQSELEGYSPSWTLTISRIDLDRFGHIMPQVRTGGDDTLTVSTLLPDGSTMSRKTNTRSQRSMIRHLRHVLCSAETQTIVVRGRFAWQLLSSAQRRPGLGSGTGCMAVELTLVLSRHEQDDLSSLLATRGRVVLPRLSTLVLRSRPAEILDVSTLDLGHFLAGRLVRDVNMPPLRIRTPGVLLWGSLNHLPSWVMVDSNIRARPTIEDAQMDGEDSVGGLDLDLTLLEQG